MSTSLVSLNHVSKRTSTDTLSPGALALSNEDPGILPLECNIDIIDHPHLESTPFMFQLSIPTTRHLPQSSLY
jgi:hypothetical protein